MLYFYSDPFGSKDTRRGFRVPKPGGVSQDCIGKYEVRRLDQNTMNVFCTAQENYAFRHSIEVDKRTTGEITFASSSYFASRNGA